MSITKEPTYSVWVDMRHRCNTKSNSNYHKYGAIGIKISSDWDDFKSFQQWCYDNGWSRELMIDRIDGTEGYSPSNCRIVTPSQNQQNRARAKNGTSKFKGVYYKSKNGRKNWRTRLRSKEHGVHEAFFSTEIEAAIEYNRVAKEWYGEYAYINIIND